MIYVETPIEEPHAGEEARRCSVWDFFNPLGGVWNTRAQKERRSHAQNLGGF